MEQQFIIRKHHSSLTLFFTGWSMDIFPFDTSYIPSRSDYMICYDYRNLKFDYSLLDNYRSVYLIAWSMGVWAASQVFAKPDKRIKRKIAVNGTLFPVNDNYGIPVSIFEGTLKGLNELTYRKFLLRMCKNVEAGRAFSERALRGSIEELREELEIIGRMARTAVTSSCKWDIIFIGKEDYIFPFENQLRTACKCRIEKKVIQAPHYSRELFREVFGYVEKIDKE